MGSEFDQVAESRRGQKTRAGIDQRQPGDAEGRCQFGGLHPQRCLEQQPGAPVKEFKKPAVEDNAGGVAMAPLDGKAPPMNEFGHYRMIPKSGSNNKLKRNGGSTPFRFIAAKRRR